MSAAPFRSVLNTVLPVLAAGALMASGGCGGPPARLAEAGAASSDLPDSLGVATFASLPPDVRAARRARAERWRRQAGRSDDLAARLEALATAAGLAPDDADTWLDLAELRALAGDNLAAETALDGAAAAVRRANDLDYDRPVRRDDWERVAGRTALLRAWLHYGRAEWREGLDWARAALRLSPGNAPALRVRGLLEAALQHRSQAHEVAGDLRRQDIFDPSVPWIMAILDLAQGRTGEAYDWVEDLRPEPERALACWRDMGRIAEQVGEWSMAGRWYGESRAALPDVVARSVTEVRHRRLDATQEAELPAWIAPGRHYVTGSLSAYAAYALARFHAAGTEAARAGWGGVVVDAAGILVRRGEDVPWARRARGLVFVDRDHVPRGLEDLERAEAALGDVAGRDARLQAGIGHAWLARGNHHRAVPPLRRAVRLDPDLAGAWSDLGLALVMAGEADGARAAFDRALELDDSLVTAWYNRGLQALHAGDFAAAERDLARAARLAPDNAEIAQLLQQVRRRSGADGAD